LWLSLKTTLDFLEPLFIIPEKTKAGYSFADTPFKITFNESTVVFYGVPLDITTTFGKGAARGPEAIRLTSALQIETFLLDEKVDIYERAKIYDLGDLRIPLIKNKKGNESPIIHSLNYLDKTIPEITDRLVKSNKLPVIMGGEHTVTYYSLRSLAKIKPMVIHFDAHRDMKPEYNGMKICHTTPFYHLMREGYIPGTNIIQIGIRQTDKQENKIAEENGVVTFDAWEIHRDIDNVLDYLKSATFNKKLYISFDIDVYDIPYVPCTGTPEPFGLNPFEMLEIIKSLDKSSKLVGIDIVEVGLRNSDYREGTLATQTLFRLLSRNCITH
jgi:agmatinase